MKTGATTGLLAQASLERPSKTKRRAHPQSSKRALAGRRFAVARQSGDQNEYGESIRLDQRRGCSCRRRRLHRAVAKGFHQAPEFSKLEGMGGFPLDGTFSSGASQRLDSSIPSLAAQTPKKRGLALAPRTRGELAGESQALGGGQEGAGCLGIVVGSLRPESDSEPEI